VNPGEGIDHVRCVHLLLDRQLGPPSPA